jgi:putative phosphoesterase
MLIGVISDTHGNLKLMHHVAGMLAPTTEMIYHLGDNYVDAEELGMSGHTVRAVPGLWCEEFHNHRVPNCIIESIDGISISCAHAPQVFSGPAYDAAIIMMGHTHVAMIDKQGKSIMLNPGHLKAPMDRGQRPSYATIDLQDKKVDIAIHETSGEVRFKKSFKRSALKASPA